MEMSPQGGGQSRDATEFPVSAHGIERHASLAVRFLGVGFAHVLFWATVFFRTMAISKNTDRIGGAF
jgi:hypothetical protein